MKVRNLLLVLIGVFTLYVNIGVADHTLPAGSFSKLGKDTNHLDYVVRYSTLRYDVKWAVSNFAYDVKRLLYCVKYAQVDRDHDLLPEKCEYDLHRVQYSFYPVDRYLYDTYYDYPNVYYAYLAVRKDLKKLPK